MMRPFVTLIALALSSSLSLANSFESGQAAIQKMAGCFLVDYSYVEVEPLKPGYDLDRRVYDVNRSQSVKEWITVESTGDRKLRLQHILFSTDLAGNLKEGALLKHQAEDWEYEPEFVYEFTEPGTWQPRSTRDATGKWVRRITNLDDGPRYQCLSSWQTEAQFPEWSCENYAPIPGRETRDMGRKDYQTLQRSTRIIVYGDSWLERQDNVKTIHGPNGEKTPLAREQGKNWYVRLPDSDCAPAQAFAEPRRAYWSLLRETWDGVYASEELFSEATPQRAPPRFVAMMQVEAEATAKNLEEGQSREEVREKILEVITRYKKR